MNFKRGLIASNRAMADSIGTGRDGPESSGSDKQQAQTGSAKFFTHAPKPSATIGVLLMQSDRTIKGRYFIVLTRVVILSI